ncbi:MAG: LysM peptidoglycan-binding domain-containing protein [Actinomycetota bacterium]|nr:LysM peptidoglycan-binding domain-containing protein [Actinomycetota bacterium]
MRRRPPILPPLLWSIASLGALAALSRVERGDPRFDVPADLATWPEWWSSHDPLDAGAALGRWLALVLLGYLTVVSLLHLAAALAPRGRIRRVATASTPRFLTGLLAGAVVVAGTSTVGAAAPDPTVTPSTSGSNPPVMRVLDPPATSDAAPSETTTPIPERTATTSTPGPPTTPTTTAPPPVEPRAATDAPLADEQRTGQAVVPNTMSPDEVVVAPGDHLWAIARRALSQRLGGDPSDMETADYWRRLIDTNRDRLVDPHDPSLIHPGQRLVLPA